MNKWIPVKLARLFIHHLKSNMNFSKIAFMLSSKLLGYSFISYKPQGLLSLDQLLKKRQVVSCSLL